MAAGLPRRLYRSRTDKMLGGVSGGLAAYFDIDAVLVRLLWVVGTVFTGGLLALAYILLWIIVPQEDYTGADVVRDNMNELAAEARRVAEDVRGAFRSGPTPRTSPVGEASDVASLTETTEATPVGEPSDVASPTETSEGTPVGETGVIPAGTEQVGPSALTPVPGRSRELLSPAEAAEARRRRTMTAGAILLGLGLIFFASNLGLFRWFNWGLYWPLLLVVLGALLIWNRSRSGT
jgi:phage shock protein C